MEEDRSEVSMAQCAVFRFVQKLRQQNDKLRGELDTLKTQLKQAQKIQKKNEIEQHRPKFAEGQDEEVKSLMAQLQAHKKEAASLKVQLSTKDDETLATLSNELAFLKNQLKGLEREHEASQKIAKEQNRALGSVFNEKDANAQLEKLKKELNDLVERERELKNQLVQGQTERKIVHSQMVDMKNELRKLQSQKNRVKAGKPVLEEVSEEQKAHDEELSKLKAKCETLKKVIQNDKKAMKQRLAALEVALAEATKAEQEKSQVTAKCEQDIQLKEIKVKELKTIEKQLQKRQAELKAEEEEIREKKSKEKELQVLKPQEVDQSHHLEAVHEDFEPAAT